MLLRSSIAGLVGCLVIGCLPPSVAHKDMLRDARIGCEKGSGAACYHAGVLYAETNSKDRALASQIKGCSLKYAPSCDALASVAGPSRESVLNDACSAG